MSGDFTAGVVEGFYGVPWTSEQRKILFGWMQKMGLNTYMYAPKDDFKHRAFWRELYSVEEADNLTNLIESAHLKGVMFVYAISPGLDICFSNSKDVQALKRKLEQVAVFGCKAFAILFDDIDPQLSEADQSAFSSSACAQVSITNELFQHLNQPKFYFCPTEYCASRALPNVSSSGYLNIIGTKLLPGIDILWTGCKVITKKMTVKTMEDITTVLKRAPVIWDNIHANDYDPRRVFLGPYDGRLPEIIPYIRGVMTNPNCEFEANFIACHTLGQWCRSNPDGVKKDIICNDRLSPVAANIKLETENDLGFEEDPSLQDIRYQPKQALKIAMSEWLSEISTKRDPPKRNLPASTTSSANVLPDVVNISPVSGVTETLSHCTSVGAITPAVDSLSADCSSEVELNPSFQQPLSVPNNSLAADCSLASSINSLASEAFSDTSDSFSDIVSEVEPMECTHSSGAVLYSSNVNILSKANTPDNLMQMEECEKFPNTTAQLLTSLMTIEDVSLLVDLFYLPFEHGSSSLQLLYSFHWLLNNAHCLQEGRRDCLEGIEWIQRLEEFEKKIQALDILMTRLFLGPNKSVLCDLYAYLWDLKGVLSICLAYLKWLERGVVCNIPAPTTGGFATWFSKGYREAFSSGDHEPWVFRGGLQAELQRLLPISAAQDLFLLKPPEFILPKNFVVRPYNSLDEATVYQICLKTCNDGMEGSKVFQDVPLLIGDRFVGNFLVTSPEFCFVVEDDDGMCGYATAAPDTKELAAKSQSSWLQTMRERYPKLHKADLSPAEEIMDSFHSESLEVPEEVYKSYPSVLRMNVLVDRMADPAVPRRLLASVLCALKASGSHGVHTRLNISDKYLADFFTKLGFGSITLVESLSEGVAYMGRLM